MKTLIIITTSHKPSQRTRSFVKDLANTLPFSLKINRGKKTIDDLGLEAYRNNASYVFIVGERKGNPSLIKVYRLDKSTTYPSLKHIASIKIIGVKLSREIPEASRVYNPEKLHVDYEGCISLKCYQLSDIFMKIYKEHLDSSKPDLTVFIEERDNVIYLTLRNRLNKLCGPIMKISDVRIVA